MAVAEVALAEAEISPGVDTKLNHPTSGWETGKHFIGVIWEYIN